MTLEMFSREIDKVLWQMPQSLNCPVMICYPHTVLGSIFHILRETYRVNSEKETIMPDPC